MRVENRVPAAPKGAPASNVGSPRQNRLGNSNKYRKTWDNTEPKLESPSIAETNHFFLALDKINGEIDIYLRKNERERLKIQNLTEVRKRLKDKVEEKRRAIGKARNRTSLIKKHERGLRGKNYEMKLAVAYARKNKADESYNALRNAINGYRIAKMRAAEEMVKLNDELEKVKEKRENIVKELKEKQITQKQQKKAARILSNEVDKRVNAMKAQWKRMGAIVDAKTDKERAKVLTSTKTTQETEEGGPHINESSDTEKEKAYALLAPFDYLRKRTEIFLQDSENTGPLAGQLSVMEEKVIRRSIQKGNWKIARGQAVLKSLDVKAAGFQEGFEIIQERTGVTDTEVMVDNFIQREEENYRLFSHVNNLSERIEELERHTEAERSELEKFRGKDDDQNNEQSVLKSLEKKLETVDDRFTEETKVIESAEDIIAKAIEIVFNIFKALECDFSLVGKNPLAAPSVTAETKTGKPVKDISPGEEKDTAERRNTPNSPPNLSSTKTSKLSNSFTSKSTYQFGGSRIAATSTKSTNLNEIDTGDEQDNEIQDDQILDTPKITEHNLMQYLGVIEQRITEILTITVCQSNKRNRPEESVAFLKGRLSLRNSVNTQSNNTQNNNTQSKQVVNVAYLPSTEVNEDWLDAEDIQGDTIKPLSHEELWSRMKQNEQDGVSQFKEDSDLKFFSLNRASDAGAEFTSNVLETGEDA